MRDDDLVEGCDGTGKNPADDRVELGRSYDVEGRLLQITYRYVPIVEVREYVTEPDCNDPGAEGA